VAYKKESDVMISAAAPLSMGIPPKRFSTHDSNLFKATADSVEWPLFRIMVQRVTLPLKARIHRRRRRRFSSQRESLYDTSGCGATREVIFGYTDFSLHFRQGYVLFVAE
jgi:hypothetical protein